MTKGRLASALFFGWIVIGCGASFSATPPPGFHFPINKLSAGNAAPTALLSGLIEVRDGCFYVKQDGVQGPGYLIGWPTSLHLSLDAAGSPVILSGSAPVASPGSALQLGGGAYESAESEAFARAQFDSPVPCPGPVWLGWSLVPKPR